MLFRLVKIKLTLQIVCFQEVLSVSNMEYFMYLSMLHQLSVDII